MRYQLSQRRVFRNCQRRRIRENLSNHGGSTSPEACDISLKAVIDIVAKSNRDIGGRVIELSETEYMVRGKGYLRGISDIEHLVVKAHEGMPVLLRDIARVELAPDERRGITELNGEGEAVSGIVVARYGENALDVIRNIEAKIDEIKPGLPASVEIQPVYDRSDLIERAIETLSEVLIEQVIIVALVCAAFLMHVRSA